MGGVVALLILSSWCIVHALNCPPLPSHTPGNVTDLHPGDIKVVLAMGDSITAAFGARGYTSGLNEARGLSFSIGGDQNATTLANFIRYYSPSLQGFSLGQHILEFCHGPLCPPFQYRPALDVLNSAQCGAVITDLITHELDYLLKTMSANPNINVKSDWKLLTLFIGGNDLCDACNDTLYTPDEFELHLRNTLERIRALIPRVFVQVIEIFNVSQILKNPTCAEIHREFSFECPCLFDAGGVYYRQQMDIYAQQYNQRSRAVAASYQSAGYPEFTVVAQPFFRNTAIDTLPLSILSTMDCFHPSTFGHEIMAIALWYPGHPIS